MIYKLKYEICMLVVDCKVKKYFDRNINITRLFELKTNAKPKLLVWNFKRNKFQNIKLRAISKQKCENVYRVNLINTLSIELGYNTMILTEQGLKSVADLTDNAWFESTMRLFYKLIKIAYYYDGEIHYSYLTQIDRLPGTDVYAIEWNGTLKPYAFIANSFLLTDRVYAKQNERRNSTTSRISEQSSKGDSGAKETASSQETKET